MISADTKKIHLQEELRWLREILSLPCLSNTSKYQIILNTREQNAVSELLKVFYSGGHAWVKGTQVVMWGRIPGVTPWSEDLLGHKMNG